MDRLFYAIIGVGTGIIASLVALILRSRLIAVRMFPVRDKKNQRRTNRNAE